MTEIETKNWYAIGTDEVLRSLNSSTEGISEDEASKRLEIFGPNELVEEKKVTPLELFVGQFKSVLVIILIISAFVSAFVAIREGEAMTDTYVILFIVIMNAVLGFIQEYRAEQAVEALKKMVSPHVLVLRGGREMSIDSNELVPGDVILLEAGGLKGDGIGGGGARDGTHRPPCCSLRLG